MRRVVVVAVAVLTAAAAVVAVAVVEAGGVAFEHAVPNVHLADSSVNTVHTHKTSGHTPIKLLYHLLSCYRCTNFQCECGYFFV